MASRTRVDRRSELSLLWRVLTIRDRVSDWRVGDPYCLIFSRWRIPTIREYESPDDRTNWKYGSIPTLLIHCHEYSQYTSQDQKPWHSRNILTRCLMRRRRYDHDRFSESEMYEEWSRYNLSEGRMISLAVGTRIDDLSHR